MLSNLRHGTESILERVVTTLEQYDNNDKRPKYFSKESQSEIEAVRNQLIDIDL